MNSSSARAWLIVFPSSLIVAVGIWLCSVIPTIFAQPVIIGSILAMSLVNFFKIVPNIKNNDILEFVGRVCLLIPLVVSVVTMSWLYLDILIRPQSGDGLAILVVPFGGFEAFVISFALSIPIAIFEYKRRAKNQNQVICCSKCGYRIDNIRGPNCPECGQVFRYDDNWSPKEMSLNTAQKLSQDDG
ncbi:MAG: hypothetical protein HJJLKODD_02915 [Phycisphaerae bacterium]|nr:hypothetical protein [Phycisphaerae bacterium]